MMYVTLQEVKDHLRIDHDDEDDDITIKILGASSAVKNYLKTGSAYEPSRDSDDNPVLDSSGFPEIAYDSNMEKDVRWEVKIAVLSLVGEWYKNRESKGDAKGLHGYLPDHVIMLLYPLRDPALQ